MKSPAVIKLNLASQLAQAIKHHLNIDISPENISFSNPPTPEMGDFSTNFPLQLSSLAKKNPVDLANLLVAKIKLPTEVRDAEVVKPGFINFKFKTSYLTSYLQTNTQLTAKKPSGKPVIFEYSSPNVAKPLGVHHLLTTVIGQSIADISNFRGDEVIRINYLGDWGTQFGKLIVAIKKWGDIQKSPEYSLKHLLDLYVKFHNEAKENPELEDMARAEHVKLEKSDPENLELYNQIKKSSIESLKQVYENLGGISFNEWDSESERLEMVPEILKDGKKKKIFKLGEAGAFIATFTDPNMTPLVIQKSDGSTLYATRDIATVKHRIEKYNPQKIVYVVDVAQKLHFQQFFDVAARFSWYQPSTSLVHLSFGRMSFPDKKMSTRKGNILELNDVIQEAVVRSKNLILEKKPDLKSIDEAAHIIGVGAIKYSILSQSPETNVSFQWEKMLSFEGNSCPYLQYSYARARSILRKNTEDLTQQVEVKVKLSLLERQLLNKLFQFRDTCDEAKSKLKPNILANYLYELAQIFNKFYASSPILNEEDFNIKVLKLKSVEQFSETIKKGLQLLGGIEVLEEM